MLLEQMDREMGYLLLNIRSSIKKPNRQENEDNNLKRQTTTLWTIGPRQVKVAILNLNADLLTQNYSGYVRPFTINVHTDATEGTSPTAESANRGFCLNYVQQPCNAPTG